MGRYIFATHYWHHLLDAEEQEWSIRGKTDLDIRKDRENARLAMESDQRIIETGVGTNYIIEEKSDEKTEYLELIKRPIFDNNGNVSGIIGLINDVTEQQLLKMELEEKSKRDRLTGLYNKATCEDMIRAALHSARENETMAVMIIDTDRFKNINDTYGHTVGDKVLEQIGDVISDIFKGMDICGRFGGDEFLVLMKNVNNRDDVVTLGKELSSFLKERIKNEVYAKDVSLSIGIALYPEHGKTFMEVLSAADEALYYVKDHGRDGLCIYQPEQI
jgi:diguanylate cyclase (GGDEF)-like protein